MGSTSLTGWTIAGAVDYIETAWLPAEGARSLDMNALTAGTIAQELVTGPGKTYWVFFALGANIEGGSQIRALQVSAHRASQAYQFDATGRSVTSPGWSSRAFSFVAEAPLTTLTFTSLMPNSSQGPALDHVRVVADPR